MNKKALKTLEFDKIRALLVSKAFCGEAKHRCETLMPLSDRGQIDILLDQTGDALSRLFRNGSVSFYGLRDVSACRDCLWQPANKTKRTPTWRPC